MAGALWFRDAKKQGYEEGIQTGISVGITQGISQGIAQQKAEDEKRIAQKDALLSSKNAEITELKAQLAKFQKN